MNIDDRLELVSDLDYRARNFQNELRQKTEKLRDYYKEQFDL